jgi:hypothetical protein
MGRISLAKDDLACFEAFWADFLDEISHLLWFDVPKHFDAAEFLNEFTGTHHANAGDVPSGIGQASKEGATVIKVLIEHVEKETAEYCANSGCCEYAQTVFRHVVRDVSKELDSKGKEKRTCPKGGKG